MIFIPSYIICMRQFFKDHHKLNKHNQPYFRSIYFPNQMTIFHLLLSKEHDLYEVLTSMLLMPFIIDNDFLHHYVHNYITFTSPCCIKMSIIIAQ